jgi:putative transferase (TIGR04331 family)
MDGYFTFWVHSLMLRDMAPDAWTLEPVERETSTSHVMAKPSSKPSGFENRSSLSAFVGRLGFDHVHGTKYIRAFFSLMINLLPRRPSSGKVYLPDASIEHEFPTPFLSHLNEFLEATLPSDFGENLPAFLKKAETEKFYPGRLTITHTGSIDTCTQLVNVLAIENGERLVGFQHGGWYGTARVESWSSESEYVYHAFITWGWTEQADFYGDMVPLPSPMLSDIANSHHTTNNQLIFVGTRMSLRHGRLDMLPSPVRFLTYRKIKRDFISALGMAPRNALVYRPYNRATPILQDGAYVKRYFPQLPILKGSLHDAFLKCTLVVLDHPGTTLNLVMAANVPTVCYWDPNDWPLCSQAKVQFDRLRQAGILFDTPQAAATHINNIWSDVGAWWARPGIRAARQEWNNFHARTSPIWWWHWALGIWKLARMVSPKRADSNTAPGSLNARNINL